MRNRFSWFATLCVLLAIGLSAQQRPPGSKTGNPTPGTPQPDPPNLADRVTVTGCVQSAPQTSTQKDGDPNEPTDTRFVLNKAERKNVVPPDTGASSAAAAAIGQTVRLKAIASQLMPFVGAKVEISGEILPSGSGGGDASRPATLQVEFIQKLEASCR
jgi:hypothetical protein